MSNSRLPQLEVGVATGEKGARGGGEECVEGGTAGTSKTQGAPHTAKQPPIRQPVNTFNNSPPSWLLEKGTGTEKTLVTTRGGGWRGGGG